MSEKITITIDGKEITTDTEKKLLWVALDNDIYIPNLCAIREEERPYAGCRLCFVEIEGLEEPVTSCTQPVTEGMVVKTRTPQVDRLVKTSFELLLSDHRLQCNKCPKNKACELQKIARERKLKLKSKRFKHLERSFQIDDSPESFALDPSRCVLCNRCVWVDRNVAKAGCLGFSYRGINRIITTFNNVELTKSACTQCTLCVEACPVGALYFKE